MSTAALQVSSVTPSARAESKRIPTLDGWRCIAILMVIVCHASMTLGFGGAGTPTAWVEPLGNQGVTIFFVLSGYLITSRLLIEQELHGSVNLRNFYIRRFFRLMPAAWAYLLFRSILALESHARIGSVYLVPSLLCFRNYVPVAGAPAATAHFWSLSIEEQFYLLWPTMLLFVRRRKAFWIAVFGAIAIALWRFDCWTWLVATDVQARYATQFRADALLIGCAAALVSPSVLPLFRKWMAVPLLIAIGYNIASGTPLVPLYESTSIALLILITCNNPSSMFSRALNWRPLAWIGLMSYSLYLWQEVLFMTHTAVGILMVLLLMTAAAVVSYYFVEQPSIQWGKNIVNRRTVRVLSIQEQQSPSAAASGYVE